MTVPKLISTNAQYLYISLELSAVVVFPSSTNIFKDNSDLSRLLDQQSRVLDSRTEIVVGFLLGKSFRMVKLLF